jgi:cytochrome c oxidase subunit 2
VVAVLAFTAIGPTAAPGDALTPESGGSPNADEIDALFKLVLYIALAVFLAVVGTLVYSLVAFRARPGRVAAQIRGHTRLEVGWTIGAALILAGITIVTFTKLGAITNPAAVEATATSGNAGGVVGATGEPSGDKADLRIEVSGQQYIWRFRYPNGVVAYGEMVVPTGRTVLLDIVSQDVAHSWWIPKLGGKADAIPGYTNHAWFRIAREGVFRGQCAELCGRNHADMLAQVRALSPTRFQTWLATYERDIAHAQSLSASDRQHTDTTGARP